MERFDPDADTLEQIGGNDVAFPDPDVEVEEQGDAVQSPESNDEWQNNVMNPSTVQLPEAIAKEMFQPLRVLTKSTYTHKYWKRKQSCSEATWQRECQRKRRQT